ncbi:MAG: DUF11 domain-containing protein, partial [Anaerolineales bacterium]|nr:DUF11 domain-containing protein [Anaerolineales bacterium]
DTLRLLDGRLDEVAIYPAGLTASGVQNLYRRWQPVTLAASGPGVTTTTWTTAVSPTLDGYYQIDLRAADQQGNRNDEQRSQWAKWHGIIDTLAPRLSIEATFSGDAETAQTTYTVTAVDSNFSLTDLETPCTLQESDYRYDDSPWWQSLPDVGERLIGVEATCTTTGFQRTPPTVRACDVYGHCAAATAERNWLYVGSAGFRDPQQQIERFDLNSGQRVGALRTDLAQARAVAVDPLRQHVYWIDSLSEGDNTAVIRRAELDTGRNQIDILTIPNPSPFTYPMSLDLNLSPESGKLYWTNRDELWSANLDGSDQTLLISYGADFQLGRLALDPHNARLLWVVVDYDTYTYNISTAPLGSLGDTPPQQLIDDAALGNALPIDLAVNPQGAYLYWMQRPYVNAPPSAENGLYRANLLDGTAVTKLLPLNVPTSIGFIDVSPAGNYLYWSTDTDIFQTNLSTAETTTFYQARFPVRYPLSAAVVQLPGTTITRTNLVLDKQAPIDLAPQGQPFDYVLRVTNEGPLTAYDVLVTDTLPATTSFVSATEPSCTAVPDSLVQCQLAILPVGDTAVITLSLTSNGAVGQPLNNAAAVQPGRPDDLFAADNTAVENRVRVAPVATPTPSAGFRYLVWGDFTDLQRVNLNTIGDVNRFPVGLQEIRDVAYDPVNDKLYWTAREYVIGNPGGIFRADADGSNVEQILTVDDAPYPGYLEVDPVAGHIYFTTGGRNDQNVSIDRLNLDGTQRLTLYDTIFSPGALLLDSLRGQFYWTDGYGQLNQAPQEGNGAITTLLAGPDADAESLALDPYGERLYFSTSDSYERM